MGDIVAFGHARASTGARRSAGKCIFTSASYDKPPIPAAGAAAKIKSQYSTGMRPARFCSDAVEGPLPMMRANAAEPPKASISSATVAILRGAESDMADIYRNSVDRVNRTSVEKICFVPDMGTSSERLKKARELAGFKSARSAAIKFKWTPSTYASHENGQTPEVPRDAAITYARAFKVSPSWILTGEGPIGAMNVVRVMGRIGAGGEISPDMEQVPEDGLDEVELPMPVGPDAVAFQVIGNSMAPRYDQGAIIVCSSGTRDPESFIGKEVAVRTADGRRYLKKLRPGTRRGSYTLESFNAEPIQNVRVAWLGEILVIVPAARAVSAIRQQATG